MAAPPGGPAAFLFRVGAEATVSNPNGVSLTFTYDDGGRLSRITRPGSYIEYQYNARNWVTAVLNRTTEGATIFDSSYDYQDGALWDHTGNPLRRTESVDGLSLTTTYRYDHVYRLTEDTRRNSGGGVDWTITYGYDQVGNRTSRIKDGTTVTYTYDDNDKLTAASGGGQTANFFYNEPHPSGPVGGNITKVTGSMLGTWTLGYDDENRPTSISYPGGADTFLYNALGQRMRVVLNGTARRYFYHGERVLEETNDTNGTQVRYTSAGSSYYEPLAHFKRADGSIRLPLMDGVGTVRRLVDQNAGVTDLYSLDAFGRYLGGGANPTPNPYRFGGAWGYITDTPGSGLLQLGARFYWPEVGRFVQQDPAGDGMNWYAYAENSPVYWVDPSGLIGGGVCLSETTDVGLVLGGGQTGSLGFGLFGGGRRGLNTGSFKSWGGFLGGVGLGRGYPRRPARGDFAVGAYGGGGLGLFLTNAANVDQLKGPFRVLNINAGWLLRGGSLQLAYGGGTFVVSYGGPWPAPVVTGIGWGAAVSHYWTNTWGW